ARTCSGEMSSNSLRLPTSVLVVTFHRSLSGYTQNAGAKEEIEIVPQTGHTAEVLSVAFSPDGRYIVSGSWDETVRLWEVESGKQMRKFKRHTSYSRVVLCDILFYGYKQIFIQNHEIYPHTKTQST
ncbi:MAG: hypothetical protein QME42_04220, partial [bacterium]|nr:hypothetical protein [bacterium]